MADEAKSKVENDEGGDSSARGYERSKIGFPYGDLDDALQVARALSEHGGLGAMDQLAAWLEHDNVSSGTFRLKVAAARIFGLIEIKGEQASLTDLGNEIVRPESEPRARALAFLNVPLFRALFEKYKGKLLPGNAVLESDMVELGVASKQKARARQGFQRSAEIAKLGKDRLVLPAGVSLDSKPSTGGASRKVETPSVREVTGEINPALAALIEELPSAGEWTRVEHDLWMRVFLRTLDKLYQVKEP